MHLNKMDILHPACEHACMSHSYKKRTLFQYDYDTSMKTCSAIEYNEDIAQKGREHFRRG